MCIYCERSGTTKWHSTDDAVSAASLNASSPLVDFTVTIPLPTFTTEQIIQALRTSYIAENTATAVETDFVMSPNTRSWGTTGDIIYRVDTSTMSQFERGRIDLAFEVWDDLIAVNIRNDQTAGDPGSSSTRFNTIRFVATGDDAGSAAYKNAILQKNAAANEYGTIDSTINGGNLLLGRTFSGGEFNGMDASGKPDNGLSNLTLFQKRGFETVLHEIGHGLGLSHPGFYNNGDVEIGEGVRFDQDSRRNTIMSYRTEGDGADSNANWNGRFAATPMVYDIAAIQRIYGADTQAHLGNTVYGFNNTSGRVAYDFSTTMGSVFSIWDSGGIDALDASQFKFTVNINLAPGSFSSIGQSSGNFSSSMIENVGIAFGTTIENAIGGAGDDIIAGNGAKNSLRGGDGFDTLYGYAGNDTLDGQGGTDWMIGGTGNDTYHVNSSGDAIFELSSQGRDTIVAKTSYTMPRNTEVLVLSDGPLDFLARNATGSSANDEIHGNRFDNIINGKGGADSMSGGSGNDTYYVDAPLDIVQELPGEGTDSVFSSLNNYTLRHDVENLHLIGAAYIGTGNERNNSIFGNDIGNILTGGSGLDRLEGGKGDDSYALADAAPVIIGQDGETDYFYDVVSEAVGQGTDTVFVGRQIGNTGYALGANIENGVITGIQRFDLAGNELGNTLTGNAAANVLTGLAGNDRLDGRDGLDTLRGGAGNDVYVLNDVTFNTFFLLFNYDSVVEADNGGTDTIRVGRQTGVLNYVLGANVERGIVTGNQAFDLLGNDLGNRLTGNAASNRLFGDSGDDVLVIGAGADTMDGGDGYDTMVFHKTMVADWQAGLLDADIGSDIWTSWEAIQGSSGNDQIKTNSWGFSVELRGGAGNDVLATGVVGVVSDILKGEAGNDTLNGGAGDDMLDGGSGRDIMTGGAGADRFIFHAASDTVPTSAARDKIVDFAHGIDKIDLSAIDANSNTKGNNAFHFVSGSAFSHTAGELRKLVSDTNTVIASDVDGNGVADFQILLKGLPVIMATDFVL